MATPPVARGSLSRARLLAGPAILGVLLNCWYRGPFGIVPFALFTLPPALILGWILLKTRLPRVVAVIGAAVAALLLSYLLCAPPTTARLLELATGSRSVAGVHDLRRWNDGWARDPSFHLWFHADEATVLGMVEHLRLDHQRSDSPNPPHRFLLSVPDWWQPQSLSGVKVWTGIRTYAIELCSEPSSQVVYLSFGEL